MAEITVTLDEMLLDQVDRRAEAEGIARDAYIARAVQHAVDGDLAVARLRPDIRENVEHLREILHQAPRHEGSAAASDGRHQDADQPAGAAFARLRELAREQGTTSDTTDFIRRQRDAR